MSREEKIEFILNSRYFGLAFSNLQSFTDSQLDEIIQEIACRMQIDEVNVSQNLLTDFYIYLN